MNALGASAPSVEVRIGGGAECGGHAQSKVAAFGTQRHYTPSLRAV